MMQALATIKSAKQMNAAVRIVHPKPASQKNAVRDLDNHGVSRNAPMRPKSIDKKMGQMVPPGLVKY